MVPAMPGLIGWTPLGSAASNANIITGNAPQDMLTQLADTQYYLRAAALMHRDVIVPAAILAELYRGAGRNQAVDACLAREAGIRVRDTDRPLARLVGGVLTGAKADSRFLADAHVVAAAVETGGGVVLTGDPDDLSSLAAAYPNITVQPLP
jgi:hypothetical protein